MSKKRRETTSMPQSSAGLMRFFQDESHGVKIPPEFVMGAAILLVVSIIVARAFFPPVI